MCVCCAGMVGGLDLACPNHLCCAMAEQGEWASGKPHGQGTATHKDGEKYVGSYKAGLYHGEGEHHSSVQYFAQPCQHFSGI